MKSSIPNAGGTFQPLRHRSGTMRDRLHGYTKRTLGAGGSVTEAVSSNIMFWLEKQIYKRKIHHSNKKPSI